MATPAKTPGHELGTEVTEHTQGGFPAFRTETFAGQLLWLAISFGLLYYLMAKVALPRLQAVLEDRRARIAADLDAAAKAKAESEAAGVAYEDSLAKARATATALAKETHDRISQAGNEERKRLEAELASKLTSAETAIRSRTDEAMANVDSIARDAATAIVERLTGQAPSASAIAAASPTSP